MSMYRRNAALECGCDGRQVLTGHPAIGEYWRQRFFKSQAVNSSICARAAIVVTCRIPAGVVQALLRFDEAGLIRQSLRGPSEVMLAAAS